MIAYIAAVPFAILLVVLAARAVEVPLGARVRLRMARNRIAALLGLAFLMGCDNDTIPRNVQEFPAICQPDQRGGFSVTHDFGTTDPLVLGRVTVIVYGQIEVPPNGTMVAGVDGGPTDGEVLLPTFQGSVAEAQCARNFDVLNYFFVLAE